MKLTSNLKQYNLSAEYLQLLFIGWFQSYIKVVFLPKEARGMHSFLTVMMRVTMSAKRCGLASLLLNIKGDTPEFH